MHGPSALAVVTGLAGLGVAYVVCTWDTRALHPLPQATPLPKVASAPQAPPSDLGGTIQLHSGAWRSFPLAAGGAAAAQSEPPPGIQVSGTAPAALPSSYARPATGAVIPLSSREIREIPEPVAVSIPATSPDASESEPTASEPPADASAPPVSPSPEGRMALSGPKAEAPEPAAPHGQRQAQPLPQAAPEPESPPPADKPAENRFGPTVFRNVERNGF
jgi:hypothetical protein